MTGPGDTGGGAEHEPDGGSGAACARPLVVKLGGAALEEPASSPVLWETLCAMHRRHTGGVVLVHGGARAVDRRLHRLGLTSERRDGIRITPPEHIDEVVAALAGEVNLEVVSWIQRHGVPAVGLTLADGRTADTVKSERYAFDAGRVGEIVSGRADLLDRLLGGGFMPVVSSIGLGPDGHPLNVNADDAAAGVARIVQAAGLILLTDVPGVRGADGAVIEELSPAQAEALIAGGVVTGGMIPKVRGAVAAAGSSGVPAVIAGWNCPADLLKLASGQAGGTRVLPGEPGTARARARSGARAR